MTDAIRRELRHHTESLRQTLPVAEELRQAAAREECIAGLEACELLALMTKQNLRLCRLVALRLDVDELGVDYLIREMERREAAEQQPPPPKGIMRWLQKFTPQQKPMPLPQEST